MIFSIIIAIFEKFFDDWHRMSTPIAVTIVESYECKNRTVLEGGARLRV